MRATGHPIQVHADNETEHTGKKIVAKVAYVNAGIRFIWTSVPLNWFEYQFPHSFLAVVHAVLPRLDKMLRQRLQGSLARMAELYLEDGWDPASLDALNQFPISHLLTQR